MKFSCTQENINQGLVIAGHIANKNTNLPILSNILIKGNNKILTLSATNLEIGITIQVRSKVEIDGELTIDAKLLSDYISLLPKERIDLEFSDDNLNIQCQKQKTKIKGQVASDFPLIPKIKKENPAIIPVKNLKEAINKVIFAVSTSETRPEITGVFTKFNKNELILAATDSYRLAEKKIKLSESGKEEKKVIIPVKTLQEVSRILSVFKEDISLDGMENVEIYLTDNQIMFSYNGVDLISRLIDGQYPEYEQIIPSSYKIKTIVNKEELIKAVKTSSLFTKSGVYDIKLEFKVKNNEVIITSSSAQTGENISKIDGVIIGDDSDIILNHRYLLDGLSNINSEKVVIELVDSNSPCVLKPEVDNGYVYIIMPIKQ